MVKRALATLGIPSLLEPVGLDGRDSRRPDSVTVFPYHQGRCLTWDGTCVDTYCDSSIIDCSISPGSAAAAAEENKQEKYYSLTDRYLFEPVAVETSGVVGPRQRSSFLVWESACQSKPGIKWRPHGSSRGYRWLLYAVTRPPSQRRVAC